MLTSCQINLPRKKLEKRLCPEKKEQLSKFLFYLICLLITATFVYSRGQDINWDLLNYHFYQGYSLLNGRFSTDIAAAGLQSFLNPIPNVLAYLSIKYFAFPISAWFFLLIQLTSVPALMLLTKKIGNKIGQHKPFAHTIPALIIGLLSPIWISELGTTFFSSWTAPLVLWGVYFIFCSNNKSGFIKKNILCAGLLIGLAVGFKLTNAPFAVSALLMIVALFYQNNLRTVAVASLFFIIGCGAGFALTAWWNLYLWIMWGSPVFPLYNAVFKSEFFDLVNFRDMRWHIASIQELMGFLFEAARGTKKTSENMFADVRYLLVTLLLIATIFIKPAQRLCLELIAFLVFMLTSFLLWSHTFAYQRYLIPFDLMLGLVVWILVVRVTRDERIRHAIMMALMLSVAMLMKVPDWGHAPISQDGRNPLSVEMSSNLAATPARYVVVGSPITYVLPSLHPDSIFLGVGMSRQVDELVFKKLEETSNMPLRFIVKDHDAYLLNENLKKINFDKLKHSLTCYYIRTGIDRYIICEVDFQKKQDSDFKIDVDFTPSGHMKFGGILWEKGLSYWEQWGRWTDGSLVELDMVGCLPQGRIRLTVEGRAFGSNVDQPIKITLGAHEIIFKFTDSIKQQTESFSNHSLCIDKLLINIPFPTSPLQLGSSSDSRQLGIGLTRLVIVKD